MTYTFQNIKDQVLAKADMTNTGFIGNSELEFYINQSQDELFDLIVASYDDYFMNSLTFILDGTTDGYNTTNLNIYKLRGVDRQVSGPDTWVSIDRYNFNDRNQFSNNFGVITRFPFQLVKYAFLGTSLDIIPKQQNSGTYKLSYIPNCIPLDDGYNGVLNQLLEKWVDYIIVDSAIKCVQKEESDCSLLMAQKSALIGRIQKMAPNRDDAIPKHRSDSGLGNRGGWGGRGYFR